MIYIAIILAAPSLLVFAVIVAHLLRSWLATSMTREIEVDHGDRQCAECDPRVVRFADFDRQMDADFGDEQDNVRRRRAENRDDD